MTVTFPGYHREPSYWPYSPPEVVNFNYSECDICGALVSIMKVGVHEQWHEEIAGRTPTPAGDDASGGQTV